jgi:hypothetical protein
VSGLSDHAFSKLRAVEELTMTKSLSMLGLFLLLAGCGPQAHIEGRQDPYVPPQVDFSGSDLAQYTAVGRPIVERKNGIMYVTVPIRCTALVDLHVDCRYVFLNAQGVPIYQSSWEGGKVLQKDVQDYIKFNSTDANAADFQLHVRYSR